MAKNFWEKLKKPILALAPMADVTNIAFREVLAKYGPPDVFWTEFVSADGLCSVGRERLLVDLQYTKKQRPIVAQIFTSKPEKMYQAAKLVAELKFDGLDINMGCPDKSIEKQGAGAALIKNPNLAKEIILAAKEGAGTMPVSVKTRLGYNENILEIWLPIILSTNPAAVTIHARTRKEMSKVPARWSEVKKAVDLANQICGKSRPIILGNGDVVSLEDAYQKIKESGADGAMVGRGLFGNPWFFNKKQKIDQLKTETRLAVMLEHTLLFNKFLGGQKNFDIMKKHYKTYVTGWDGAKELRMELMKCKQAEQVVEIILKHYPKIKVAKV